MARLRRWNRWLTVAFGDPWVFFGMWFAILAFHIGTDLLPYGLGLLAPLAITLMVWRHLREHPVTVPDSN